MKIKLASIFLTCLVLLLLSSCKTKELVGNWEFIEVYDGIVNHIDTLRNKENHSKEGTGTLVFHKNGVFNSMENKGYYRKKKAVLKMKYSEDKDTLAMKVSYISRNYLLLSDERSSKTWFYRKK